RSVAAVNDFVIEAMRETVARSIGPVPSAGAPPVSSRCPAAPWPSTSCSWPCPPMIAQVTPEVLWSATAVSNRAAIEESAAGGAAGAGRRGEGMSVTVEGARRPGGAGVEAVDERRRLVAYLLREPCRIGVGGVETRA